MRAQEDEASCSGTAGGPPQALVRPPLTSDFPLSMPRPGAGPAPSFNIHPEILGSHYLPFPFSSLTAPPVPPPRLLFLLPLPPTPSSRPPPRREAEMGHRPTGGMGGLGLLGR